MTERDPYAVLGVSPHADAETIAGAYRDLARRHHPDVSADPDAERRMAEINAAWATLRDPAKRAAVDRAQGRSARSATAAAPTPGAADLPGAGPAARPGAYDPYAPGRPAAPPHARAHAPGSPTGRPPVGGGYRPTPGPAPAGTVPQWRRGPAGEGAAGPPPGPRRGSVLPFGRHIGWSLGEVARVDPGYLVWLKERREGAPWRAEIEQLLAAMAAVQPPPGMRPAPRRGPFRR